MISSIARRTLVGAGADATLDKDVLGMTSSAGGCLECRSGADDDVVHGSVSSITCSEYEVAAEEPATSVIQPSGEIDCDTDAIGVLAFVSLLLQ